MEWCDHCLQLRQTTVIGDSGNYLSSCTFCGKILSDSSSIQATLRNERVKKGSERIDSSNAKIMNKESLNAIDAMEWCSHCCRLCPTTILERSYGVCDFCGKVLFELNASLQVMFPDENGNKIISTMMRGTKIKHGDTSQTSKKN